MRDPMLDRLADVIVRYSTRIKPGDLVMIHSDPVAMPLIEALYERALAEGANPFWQVRSEALNDIFMDRATDEQLAFLNPLQMDFVEKVDVRIGLWAELNTRSGSNVPPAKSAIRSRANKPYMKRFFDRAAAGELRWCGTLYPTPASAQDAEMSLRDYERFVFEAGLLHTADPVAEWNKVHERQERVREYLQTKREVHFRVAPHDGHDGTDLRVNVDGGIWINCSGGENFPDGEVFCGPQGVEGHVNYSFPAVVDGREVEGVRLAFREGRVVDASARKNEEFLIAMLDQDDGARGLGEIAIGTNYAIKDFSRNTLFDEKIGGTFHAAVGAGYPESGSTNESALHWDMVCEMRPIHGHPGGTIEADGEVFHKDGRFLDASFPGN